MVGGLVGPSLCPPSAQQEVSGYSKMTLNLYLLHKNRQKDASAFQLPRLTVLPCAPSAHLSICHGVSSLPRCRGVLAVNSGGSHTAVTAARLWAPQAASRCLELATPRPC